MAVIELVVSGGQTGADRAGLEAARDRGRSTGGWMPLGWLAEDGEHPEFGDLYGLKEHASAAYPPRTAANVRESNGVLLFVHPAHRDSRGARLTRALAGKAGVPVLQLNPWDAESGPLACRWLERHRVTRPLVAGNRESLAPGIYVATRRVLLTVF